MSTLRCRVTWLCFKADGFVGYSKFKELVLNWLKSCCQRQASVLAYVLFGVTVLKYSQQIEHHLAGLVKCICLSVGVFCVGRDPHMTDLK